MTEYFELLDEEGNRIGKVKEREAVHRDGDLHGGSSLATVGRARVRAPVIVPAQSTKSHSLSLPYRRGRP